MTLNHQRKKNKRCWDESKSKCKINLPSGVGGQENQLAFWKKDLTFLWVSLTLIVSMAEPSLQLKFYFIYYCYV